MAKTAKELEHGRWAGASAAAERPRWAVCPSPADEGKLSEWFLHQKDALKWQSEIVIPATIWSDKLPRDPAAGFYTERIVPTDVPVRCSRRRTPYGSEWIVLERVDGEPITRGVGAFRNYPDADLPYELPPGYQSEVRRREQGWHYVVPIEWIDEQTGAAYSGKRFRDFLASETIGSVQTADMDTEIGEVGECRYHELSCDLGDDWQFGQMAVSATKLEGHAFRGRVIQSLGQQLTMIAYDLETALLTLHPNLSFQAIAAFWTSFSVWRHIVDWAPRVVREMIQSDRSAASLQGTQEKVAVQFIHRQMWVYAQHVALAGQFALTGRLGRSLEIRRDTSELQDFAFWYKLDDHGTWLKRRENFERLSGNLSVIAGDVRFMLKPAEDDEGWANFETEASLAVLELCQFGMTPRSDPLTAWLNLLLKTKYFHASELIGKDREGRRWRETDGRIESMREASIGLCTELANQALRNLTASKEVVDAEAVTHLKAGPQELAAMGSDRKRRASQGTVGDAEPTVALNVDLINVWMNEQGYDNEELATTLRISPRAISSLRHRGKYHGRKAIAKLASLMGREITDLYLP